MSLGQDSFMSREGSDPVSLCTKYNLISDGFFLLLLAELHKDWNVTS